MASTFLCLILSLLLSSFIFLQNLNPLYHLLPLFLILTSTTLSHLLTNNNHTYLLNYSCLTPSPYLLEHFHLINTFSHPSLAFMSKIITSSGQADTAYLPPLIRSIPPQTHHHDSLAEAHLLLFPTIQNLLTKSNLNPKNIDVLVCSTFSPSPSLSSSIINYFNMRQDTESFNISGTGCSGGAVAIDLAKNVLSITGQRSYAIVVSTEVLTAGWYPGQDRSKLLLNCTFRMGRSALLLTNKKHTASMYKLVNIVRTNYAFDDTTYNVSLLEEDSDRLIGFSVKKEITRVIKEVVMANTVALCKEILPYDEKARFMLWCLRRKLGVGREVYVPDFGRVVQHYCFPTLAKAVIEDIGRGWG